jgi:hypothetical protein
MRSLVFSLLLLSASAAAAATIEGQQYDDQITVEGKQLKLVGVGLREKWFFNVYTMGAYTESGDCQPARIIGDEEVKVLHLKMLRDVSAKKMSSTISESFSEHMPGDASEQLKAQRKTFESYFTAECSKGTELKFVYLPGTGTIYYQNGKQMGPPLEGKAFQEVLWDIYFGEKTCCKDLRQQILKSCKK